MTAGPPASDHPPHLPPTTGPSYAVVPGVPGLPPPRPRRRRPSPWWFALGGALVLAAVVSGVGLFVWTLSGVMATDVSVPVDGEPHQVSVDTDGDRMLWVEDAFAPPDCSVVDTETGEEVALKAITGEFRRDGGGGDRIGSSRFDPGSGDLEVTCTPADGASGGFVEIGPAPEVTSFVGGILATVVVPLVLGLAGFVVLVVTLILWLTGRPRSEPA